MIITIDPANPVPIYIQIVDQIVYRIASREIADGDQLPSIRNLALDLRINPNTIIKAYRELEHLNIAKSQHGKGYFISLGSADPARANWKEKIMEDLRRDVMQALSVGVSPQEVLSAIRETIEKGGNR
jgi:GntR family transcriptional regulator